MASLSANLFKLQQETKLCDIELQCSDGKVHGNSVIYNIAIAKVLVINVALFQFFKCLVISNAVIVQERTGKWRLKSNLNFAVTSS